MQTTNDTDPRVDGLKDILRQFIDDEYHLTNLDISLHRSGLVDSLDSLWLIVECEKWLRTEVSTTDITRINTAQDILDLANELLGPGLTEPDPDEPVTITLTPYQFKRRYGPEVLRGAYVERDPNSPDDAPAIRAAVRDRKAWVVTGAPGRRHITNTSTIPTTKCVITANPVEYDHVTVIAIAP